MASRHPCGWLRPCGASGCFATRQGTPLQPGEVRSGLPAFAPVTASSSTCASCWRSAEGELFGSAGHGEAFGRLERTVCRHTGLTRKIYLEALIALARQTIASHEKTFRIFTRRVEVGSTSRFNLTEVQTLLTQAQALGAQLELARAAQFNALTLLVGVPVKLPPEQGQLDESNVFRELRPGLPSDLLLQRPDIVAAEHLLKAANVNIGAARAAFFPRIALVGSLGTASVELTDLFASGSLAWLFSPSISLPIFDAGRRQNNLSLAETNRDLAVTQYEKTVQVAFRDVSDALSARVWLRQQVAIARTALATQVERARLSQLRFNNGASAFLDVLDAQRDPLHAEQQLVQTRR
ncbi:MAG: efflux transporter outer membrane subunit [Candidatus Accumulibacter sp.]|nr:efflux transporter outer membrane subunit [Accumulibacter sp.]